MPLKKSRSIIKHGSLLVEAYLNDRYVGDKGDHKLTISFFTYVDSDMVKWHSRKQRVVAYSNVQAKYHDMSKKTCEMI